MSKKELWCVAMRPEGDSPFRQTPAQSKEHAERAVARYKAMEVAEGNQFFVDNFDYFIQAQKWHSTRKEHLSKLIYVDDWFSLPMYRCSDMHTAERVFSFGEIVACQSGGKELITRSIDEAKAFFAREIRDSGESQ